MIHRCVSTGLGVRRSLLPAVAAAAVAVVLLSGCAAGDDANTSKEVPVVDGGSTRIGSIGLNAASVVAPTDNSYAQGTDARLQMYLTNNG